MKAVVVEIKDKFVAVLSDDGCITKVKNKKYMMGQVIKMNKNNSIKLSKLTMWASCAAAFVLVCGVAAWSYVAPYSYVSLDVNPSIEFSVNRYDRVLSVKAVNDDGQEILEEINLDDLKNKTIKKALKLTVKEISEKGYFDGDIVSGIVITTSSKDEKDAEKLAKELKETVEEATIENGDVVEVEAISVGKERVLAARELGVTPGKLNLVEKLKASAADPNSISIEEWLTKPVKDIMKATKDNKKEQKKNGVIDETAVEAIDSTKTETETETETVTVTETKDLAKEQIELEKQARELEKEKVKAEMDAAKEASKEEKKINKVDETVTTVETVEVDSEQEAVNEKKNSNNGVENEKSNGTNKK